MRELATDLVKKAKEIDSLIEVLPGIQQTEEEQVIMIIGMFRCTVIIYAIMSNQINLLKSLEEENQIANEEYKAAVKEMGILYNMKFILTFLTFFNRTCKAANKSIFTSNSG